MFLAESISLMHTIASVAKFELEKTPLLKFIFQITSEFEFGNLSNSVHSFGFLLLEVTTLHRVTHGRRGHAQ